jgi:protein ImuB
VRWLALHFPVLSLECLPTRRSPAVIVGRGRVLAADALAAESGVRPGQKLSTALGLLPALYVSERDEAGEARALDELACWAGRFTPTISQRPPDALLLEIGACRRLFGSLESIVAAVQGGCRELGWTVHAAVAPTPLAALWLARAGRVRILEEEGDIVEALADLPCTLPGWVGDVVARLRSFGAERLGDIRRLPADGLRQRIGERAVDDLRRALGELPDLQTPFIFPESFATALELPARVEQAEGLAFAAQRLFASLSGWLHARQQLMRAATLHLTHDDGHVTPLTLRLGEPSADEARLLRLLREHLGRLTLVAPVEALRLTADELVDRPCDSANLFATAPAGEGRLACLERLRARLGGEAVQMLGEQADYRPECATRTHDVLLDSVPEKCSTAASRNFHRGAGVFPLRPLWLLDAPQALAEYPDGPHWHGSLHFLTRGERLESGWWDTGETAAVGDVRRDYFVVRNGLGQWGWIYRDAGGWYLHGLFA